jgi:hypothetical protein
MDTNIESAIRKKDWDSVIAYAQNNGRFKGMPDTNVRIELDLHPKAMKQHRISGEDLVTSIIEWLYK